MPIRSKVLLDLRDSYGRVMAARVAAECSRDPEAVAVMRLAEQDFQSVAEEVARLVPMIVPEEHVRGFAPSIGRRLHE